MWPDHGSDSCRARSMNSTSGETLLLGRTDGVVIRIKLPEVCAPYLLEGLLRS